MFSVCVKFVFWGLAFGPWVALVQGHQQEQKVFDGFAKAPFAKEFDEERQGCKSACALLSQLIPGEVSSQGTAGYRPLAYWSAQQNEVTPACRVDVSSAESISITIKVSRLTNCPFVVRSGGHTAFAGGSSIQDGILISMKALNMVELSEDRRTASVGPGNTWYDVYTKLDPLKVSVVGGREAGVGVGGLILGGGISYFSGRHGWACDNVRNYEVVLADGSIVNANPHSNPDLYWALRGGSGSNFGIVSRFDLAAFEQGQLWGGSRYYAMSTNSSLADAFANFNTAAPTDPSAHLYIAFVHAAGSYLAVSGPAHGTPTPDPPIFNELSAIPHLVDATSVASMSTLSVELNQTAYLRETFRTFTFYNSAPLMKRIIALYTEEISPLLDLEIDGFLPAFAFQPLSDNILAHMSRNGGNALGLSSPIASSSQASSPLVIMNLNFAWSSESDDTLVHAAASRFLSRSIALAQEMKLYHRFVYMNYATIEQDVFGGYGEESVARLKAVQERYDPENVFGRLWPGYFKL